MRRLWQILFVFCIAITFSSACFAAKISFPTLTGRVVDNAHLLSQNDKNTIEQTLEQHEKETTNQLVVVTIPSLQNSTIEEYGYQLGRTWGIGKKGKNNGVLLIIEPNDKVVRIEVGYGLEGTLTDAITSQIIQTIILPKFKNKDYTGGIEDGVTAIIAVLGGKDIPKKTMNENISDTFDWFHLVFIFLFILFSPIRFVLFLIVFYLPAKLLAFIGFPALKNRLDKYITERTAKLKQRKRFNDDDDFTGFGGFGGGSSGGGGFSGGGGSFGGGGSSGKW